MAVTRHGIPWQMIPDPERRFENDVWELYDLTTDWTQSNDLAARHPSRLRQLQDLFLVEAAKHQVFPLDDRVTERENPTLAGRIDLLAGRRSVTYHGGMRRLTEETTPNIKNRSHSITADIEVSGDANGVVIAQGGAFGGWSLYLMDGVVTYHYNYFALQRFTVRSESVVPAGRHTVRVEFEYDGEGAGLGGAVSVFVDGVLDGKGRVEATIPTTSRSTRPSTWASISARR